MIAGCEKVDLPPVDQNAPVFSVNALVDGTEINWGAGDDDFYMFTSFSRDSFEVYSMTGKMAKDTSCAANCDEYLSFTLRSSYTTSNVNQFDIDQALIETSPSFFSDNQNSTIGYRYIFNGGVETQLDSFPIQLSSIDWIFPDTALTGDTVVYEYFGNQDFNIEMNANVAANCIPKIQRSIPLGDPNTCDVEVLFDETPLGAIFYQPFMPNSQGNSQVFTDPSGTSNPGDTVLLSLLGTTTLNISANDFAGCLVDLDICLDSPNPNGLPNRAIIPKMDYDFEPITSGGFSEQFSSITIEYNDGNILYNSKYGDNSNSSFTILTIENFEDNENGEKTKKLTINYNAILYNETSSDSIQISGTGIIGIAYPN